jgi:hypothetical protein
LVCLGIEIPLSYQIGLGIACDLTGTEDNALGAVYGNAVRVVAVGLMN